MEATGGFMVNRQNVLSQFTAIIITMIGTFIVFALALIYFFDWHWTNPDFPLRSYSEKIFPILITSLIATLLAIVPIWLGAMGRHKFGMIFLRTGLALQASLTLYAMAGCQGVLGGYEHISSHIFPSTFFAEYNFFTVMLEVAPVTSIAPSLLLYGTIKIISLADSTRCSDKG
jgi:hypothetical protein